MKNVLPILKTNRSLVKYIIFSILTCGIYSCYFIHSIAKDMNIMCDGDGEHTRGFWGYLFLSIFTCGIYSFIWYYQLGDRMARNKHKYHCKFTENGATILLWLLLGSFVMPILSYVSLYIIIKNINEMAEGYNKPSFFERLFQH